MFHASAIFQVIDGVLMFLIHIQNRVLVFQRLYMLWLIEVLVMHAFMGLCKILKQLCMYVCMYVCMPFYVIHYHNNLMKAHHYHKSHQIASASLEKMNIIILVFK